jgi:UDP-N-acetylglucosamine 2-epimerase (non-hydrolysing)
MLDQVLEFFNITPDYDLNLMKPNQNLYDLTADVIKGMKNVLDSYKPHFVFVHGDTTTSMAASLAAFYSNCTICHVEAGLRTWNKKSPFPEELNRVLTGCIANYHFAPTERAKQNLLSETTAANAICVTGNTVIDALLLSRTQIENGKYESIETLRQLIPKGKKIVLVTGHRRENHGEGFNNICSALIRLAQQEDILIIYPVHRNPNVLGPVTEMLGLVKNILLIDPLPYEAFIWLMMQSDIIITDSGGIQEEAPSLGKPVIVIRETTERPEAVEAGTVKLVGTNSDAIYLQAFDLLTDTKKREAMSKLHNPYGDGQASSRILNFMLDNVINQ